ncbi:hypothetical protein PMAYCL1PPCAC_06040, partial [Pristionchus mayeri]
NMKESFTSPGETESVCGICLDALTNKRLVKFNSCSHKFHRTCALKWADSQKKSEDIPCCICRMKTSEIIGDDGVTICKTYPFETKHVCLK